LPRTVAKGLFQALLIRSAPATDDAFCETRHLTLSMKLKRDFFLANHFSVWQARNETIADDDDVTEKNR